MLRPFQFFFPFFVGDVHPILRVNRGEIWSWTNHILSKRSHLTPILLVVPSFQRDSVTRFSNPGGKANVDQDTKWYCSLMQYSILYVLIQIFLWQDFRTSPWVQLPGFDSARITNVNRAESFQTVDSSRTAEFSRSESCRTAEVARAEPCRTFEVTRAESCRTTEVGRAESCRTAEVARAESCKTTEVARAESCRTTEISRVETVLAIGEPAWQKPEVNKYEI